MSNWLSVVLLCLLEVVWVCIIISRKMNPIPQVRREDPKQRSKLSVVLDEME